ncbi:MAG TPA: glutathione S-transferase N-terminal domain-containing protein [Burkholderiales bacterium]|jgi:glutathione S-transferase|nr:glutathione S-transferase N-terminal domain-containing protein [Burkholderiales bacterium]
MKLFGSPGSPFSRKVRIVLAEKAIPCEYIVQRPSAPDSPIPQWNPLGQVPTLILDDGRGLYDSAVIVEYLDTLGKAARLIPEPVDQRFEVKRWQALGDGVAEATVHINHEYREPKDKQRSADWFARQRAKIDRGLAVMEKDLGAGEFCFGGRFTLADIAAGFALDYLDQALPEVEWRKAHPVLQRLGERLARRESFSSTLPPKS